MGIHLLDTACELFFKFETNSVFEMLGFYDKKLTMCVNLLSLFCLVYQVHQVKTVHWRLARIMNRWLTQRHPIKLMVRFRYRIGHYIRCLFLLCFYTEKWNQFMLEYQTFHLHVYKWFSQPKLCAAITIAVLFFS